MKKIVLFAPIVLATVLLSGCGGTSKADLQKATAAGAAQASQAAQVAKASQDAQASQDALKAQVQQLKDAADAKATTDAQAAADAKTAADAKAAAAVPATSSCGDNVSANSNTSCAFALNVASEYRGIGGTTYVNAWSPVTQQYYSMYCAAGVPVNCRGGQNAVVYIR